MRVGDSIGRFQVLRELGRGGMGVVFAARDPRSGREVAIKALLGFDPEQRLRFLAEARALSTVRDPGVVSLLEADFVGSTPYLVMDLLAGQSLQARLATGPLPLADALALARRLAGTLQRLHAAGVVHRDLKPDNVILDPGGAPVLIDLGLALLLERSVRLTRSGEIMGTPGYMAPEQVLGRIDEMGPACDVYGLGALLFALLTGRPPFKGASAMEVLAAVVNKAPDPPSTIRREVAPALDRLVLASLAKRPDKRPLLADVQRELRQLEPGAARPPRGQGARRAAKWIAAGIVCGGTWLAWQRDRPGDAAGFLARAEERLAEGDQAGAAGDYARALELDPRAAQAHLGRGRLRLEQGDEEGALTDLDRALELDPALRARLDPGTAGAWAARGDRKAKHGDLGGARVDYDRSLELDPGAAEVWRRRGAVRQGAEPEEALSDFTRAIELAPGLGLARAERALVWVAKGDLSRAEADLAQAVELEPALQARFGPGLARAYAARGDRRSKTAHPGARADFDRALELDRGCAIAWILRGLLRHLEGDTAGAAGDWQEARPLELDPSSAVSHAERGNLGFLVKDFAEARKGYDHAIQLDPQEGLYYIYRGNLLQELGELKPALADYDRAVEQRPDDVLVLVMRGGLRRILGDLAGAGRDFDRALEIDPLSAAAYGDRSVLRLEQGDLAGARVDLDRALELDGNHPIHRARRGGLRRLQGDLEGACEDYDHALQLAPEVRDELRQGGAQRAYFQRASVRQARGDVAGARSDCDRAVELAPDFAVAYGMRGTLRHAQGDLAGARADLDRAIELDATLAPAYRDRGRVRLEQGELEGARPDFARAIELDPDDAASLLCRGVLREATGELPSARADYDRAIELAPRMVEAYHARACLSVREQDRSGAIRDFARAVRLAAEAGRVLWLEASSDRAHYYRGLAREQEGDLSGAALDLERCLTLNPSPELAVQARERLARLGRDPAPPR